jgi:hypothetical protein
VIIPKCKISFCRDEQSGTRFCKQHEVAWLKSYQGKRAYAFSVYSGHYVSLLSDWVRELEAEALNGGKPQDK